MKTGIQIVLPFPQKEDGQPDTEAFQRMGDVAHELVKAIDKCPSTKEQVTALMAVLAGLTEGKFERGFVVIQALIAAIESRAAIDSMPEAQEVVDKFKRGDLPEGLHIVKADKNTRH